MEFQLPFDPLMDTGDGDTIVLLPEPLTCLSLWDNFKREFLSTHRVLIPRLPLFSEPITSHRINDIVIYLEQFLRMNRVTRTAMIGSGMAGYFALMYAWHYPRKVKRIILTTTPEIDKSPFVSSGLSDHEFLYGEEALSDHASGSVATTSCYANNIVPSLTQIMTPVLLISGLQDNITPPETAIELRDLLPCSKAVFMDNCGHRVMHEQADLFNEHVRNFMK